MKSFVALILLCSTTLLLSCESRRKKLESHLVDLDEFHIENDRLHSGDSLEILGASGNLENEDKLDAYILYVVKSIRTGETLNILSNEYILIRNQSDPLIFVSDSDIAGKLAGYQFHNHAIPKGNFETLPPLSFDKVFYDTEYISADVRNYPAVTGSLVQYYVQTQTKTDASQEASLDSLTNSAIESVRH